MPPKKHATPNMAISKPFRLNCKNRLMLSNCSGSRPQSSLAACPLFGIRRVRWAPRPPRCRGGVGERVAFRPSPPEPRLACRRSARGRRAPTGRRAQLPLGGPTLQNPIPTGLRRSRGPMTQWAEQADRRNQAVWAARRWAAPRLACRAPRPPAPIAPSRWPFPR